MASVRNCSEWNCEIMKLWLQSTDAKDVCVRLQGFAVEAEARGQGFRRPLPRQWQKITGFGFRGRGGGAPPLTCLHTGDTGGVKHPLPLSRAQRDLVCQQVYLTQRPTQRVDKTVEQRQPNVSVKQSKAMHLWLHFTHTRLCFSNELNVWLIIQHVTRGALEGICQKGCSQLV